MCEHMQEENDEKDDLFEHYRILVDSGQQPLRIDKFLSNRLPSTSRNRIQKAIENGNILVNKKTVKTNYKVKAGDEISVVLPTPPRELELIPENIPLDIVYEDDQLIVINKKPGMVVHPGHGNYTGTLVNALIYHFNQLPGDHVRPGLVHRIDKNTSGLMVVAKTEESMTHLAGQFFNRTIERRYWAIIWGTPDKEEGRIEGHIGRSLKDRKVMDVFPDGSYGKPAITHYKLLKSWDYVSLVECKLETGRTHQIRVHMRHIGHPLFNDPEYGGDKILRGIKTSKYIQFVQNCFKILPRQALHAKTLGFIHPTGNHFLQFDSDVPQDMKRLMEKWDVYLIGRRT